MTSSPHLEQPALLYPFTTHWRWTSRQAWEEEIRDLAGRLPGLPSDTRVGFRWRPRPLALTHDRALLRAGLVGVAVDERIPGSVDHWLGDDGPPGLPRIELGEGADRGVTAEGRVWVEDQSGEGRLWGADERRRAAASVRQSLGPPRAARPLAFVSGCPSAPLERAYLEWCLEEGAALLLAGDRDLAGPSFVWSRPTVACLDAERLAGVEAALRSAAGLRRLRRRFRRLEAILLPAEPDAASADRQLWAALDVRLVAWPEAVP